MSSTDISTLKSNRLSLIASRYAILFGAKLAVASVIANTPAGQLDLADEKNASSSISSRNASETIALFDGEDGKEEGVEALDSTLPFESVSTYVKKTAEREDNILLTPAERRQLVRDMDMDYARRHAPFALALI